MSSSNFATVPPEPTVLPLFCSKRLGFAAMLLTASIAAAAAAQTNELFNFTNTWRYWQSGPLDTVNWKAPDYDDSAWPSGPGLFYVETATLPAAKSTPLILGQRTYYFRTGFEFAGGAAELALAFRALIDDGAVFYLNGKEIRRVGMPATGIITSNTLASRTVGDATTFDNFTLTGSVLTNLAPGTNVLAVEVHQSGATSDDIVFGSVLHLITGLVPRVTRGPYLQNASPSSITLRWRTDLAMPGRVRFGTDLANLESWAEEPAVTTEHEVRLTNLLAATTYYYSIGTSSQPLVGGDTNHFFITSPIPGTPQPARIWVIGDSGTKNINQVRVRDAYANVSRSRHTDLWLMLGDNAYDSGTEAEYQSAVFNIYTNLLRTSTLWPTLGNHDSGGSTAFNDNYPYFSIFSLPKNGESGGMASGSEHYYSFDYANIHFVCLDSMTANRSPSGVMARWLTNDLANVTADWIIAFWHHPPYTKGSHDSDTETELIQMRQNLLPILEAYGVDMVLTGHSHCYERSYLLDRHYGVSRTLSVTNKLDGGSGRENGTGAYRKQAGDPIGHRGAVYAVVGSSGQISGGSLNHPAKFVSLNQLGSLVLDIHGDRLDAFFLRDNGTTNDFFTMLKVNTPPAPPTLIAPSNAASLIVRYPALDVSVTDADSNILSVSFHGRALMECQGPEPHHGLGPDSGLRSPNPFTVLGKFTGVSSGSELGLVWTNLQPKTTHEWYVTSSDGKDTTVGPTWRFTTEENLRPRAYTLVLRVPGDTATQLQLVAADRNLDPLTFVTDTPPRRGLLSGLSATNGLVTYTPAHGAVGPDMFKFHVNDGLADSAPGIMHLLVQAPKDVNHNGLPDAWERTYGIRDPGGDADADGLANLQEYLANTDPTNAASALRIVSMVQNPDGHFTLTWSASGGSRYRVSYSDAETGSGSAHFKDIVRPISEEMNSAQIGSSFDQGFTDDFSQTSTPANGFRYYRVRVITGDQGEPDQAEQ